MGDSRDRLSRTIWATVCGAIGGWLAWSAGAWRDAPPDSIADTHAGGRETSSAPTVAFSGDGFLAAEPRDAGDSNVSLVQLRGGTARIVPVAPNQNVPHSQLPPIADDPLLTDEERIAVSVYENCNRSVVNINAKGTVQGLLLEYSAEGAGSGSVLDQAGHILTNYHVIEGGQKIQVTLHDGKSYDAKLIGADPVNDVAVIKIEAPPEILYPLQLGDSNRLRVGMRVFAIGNPFGLERTLTTGVVSSLNRALMIRGNRTVKSIIQVDAAINPGSSGGPLIDARGHLIGMNTAIASTTGQSAGVGFAIPAALIARIVPQLIQQGRVVRPDSGVSRVYQNENGLLIAGLTPGGPAEQAGLRGPQIVKKRRGLLTFESVDRGAADLIIGVDDRETKTADDFLGYIESKQPGDVVNIVVVREGRTISVPVQLSRGE